MSNDYLWDRSGPPDAEVVRLELLLARYAYRQQPGPQSALRNRARLRIGIAASVLIACGTLVLYSYERRQASTCEVSRVEGNAQHNGATLQRHADLRPGDWIDSGNDATVRVRVGKAGHIDVGPGSQLRVGEVARNRYRFSLAKGSMKASIVAAPFAFGVAVPGAMTYDLGCEYAIGTDDHGNGSIEVTSGWVRLDAQDVVSFVGQGTRAAFRRSAPPGVPVRSDASEALEAAVRAFSFGSDPALRDHVFNDLLALTGQHDAVTLVNLIWRVDAERRGRVFDRLSEWHPPPPSVTRDRVQAGDLRTVAEWWYALGFGNVKKLAPQFDEWPSRR